MTGIHAAIAASALGLATAAATGAEWRSAHAPVEARFWFDGAAFELPSDSTDCLRCAWTPDASSGQLSGHEVAAIERLARAELSQAFAGLRISFESSPRAAYQVRVVPEFPVHIGPQRLAAAESIVLGPLGNHGWVSFGALAGLALKHAPPHADRAAVLGSIGRGIGRVAAHEFAHQILGGVDLHIAADPASYEYASADRAAEFHGPMRWDFAEPLLEKQLKKTRGVRE